MGPWPGVAVVGVVVPRMAYIGRNLDNVLQYCRRHRLYLAYVANSFPFASCLKFVFFQDDQLKWGIVTDVVGVLVKTYERLLHCFVNPSCALQKSVFVITIRRLWKSR